MIPYPFQRHLRHLPYREKADAVHRLLATLSRTTTPARGRVSYAEWLSTTFGDGLMRHFFEPYNAKIWSVALTEIKRGLDQQPGGTDRLGGRSHRLGPRSGPARLGAEPSFLPARAGSVMCGARLPTASRRPRFGTPSVEIDWKNKHVSFADGSEESYTDSSLDDSARPARRTAPPGAGRASPGLGHTTPHHGPDRRSWLRAPTTSEHNWLYFPGSDVPFYRASNPAKNAPSNVPARRHPRYSSWCSR